MFRKISIIIVLFLNASIVFGQGAQFGILFDPAVIWLQSDDKNIIPDEPRLGFDIGMSADFYFAQNYAFATGLSLLNTGGTLKYMNGTSWHTKENDTIIINPREDVKYKLQYVKIPVGLKFKTHMIGRMVYSANLGFDIMVRASSRADFRDEKNANVNNAMNLFTLGWHFGIGTMYSLGGDAGIFFGLSYLDTFLDITQSEKYKITSKSLFLRIGMIF